MVFEMEESAVVTAALEYAKAAGHASLADMFKTEKPEGDGSWGKNTKARRIDIPKLEDANMAGTKESKKCTLILTEGDSAKSLAVAGLSIVGRDYYGVFPLRGKVLNVREAAQKAVTENKEVGVVREGYVQKAGTE